MLVVGTRNQAPGTFQEKVLYLQYFKTEPIFIILCLIPGTKTGIIECLRIKN